MTYIKSSLLCNTHFLSIAEFHVNLKLNSNFQLLALAFVLLTCSQLFFQLQILGVTNGLYLTFVE